MMTIEARQIGRDCALVTLELGPPHNQKFELGTFSKYGLLRFTQEMEHDMDCLNDLANKINTAHERGEL